MTSVAFATREVARGTTVAFHGNGSAGAAYELFDRVTASRRREEEEEVDGTESSGSSSIGNAGESSLSLSSSSSTADDDGRQDCDDEVQSELKDGALVSMESLEECLPIKRGLSSCFAGKSKSFASLAEAAALGSAGSLSKPENPFNKRRRILMACKKASWQRRASYAALNASALRSLEEEDGDEDDVEPRDGDSSPAATRLLPTIGERRPAKNANFRSTRCFSLTDLQHA